ncbi:MAG: cephalosporin hydroxylase family protein [Planctomycetaceae bacterium]|jgi:cephalosporin hydroxylase|nr:cephalosporin hydroxylase family protein [Planctomycetaceae bacterium]
MDKQFKSECNTEIEKQNNPDLRKKAYDLLSDPLMVKYVYRFTWLGRPIIQYPQDIIAFQEIIWEVKPDLIIEAGIAHDGSIIFSASMMELLGGNGRVLGIDIDIRQHNRIEIEKHPMFKRITMFEGSSIDSEMGNMY